MKDYRKLTILLQQPSTYDIFIEQLLPVGERMMSGRDIMIVQLYKDALKGDLKATAKVLKMIDINVQERNKRQERGTWYTYSDDYEEQNCSMQSAMMVLGIGAYHAPRQFGIAPWLVDVAVQRGGKDHPWHTYHDREDFYSHYRHPADGEWPRRACVEGHCCRHAAERERRSAVVTRFQPGRSGNPRGRPLNRRHGGGPFWYFEEPETFSIAGETYRMSRAEAFWLQLVIKASKGDLPIRQMVATYAIEETLARWRRREQLCVMPSNDPDRPNPFARRCRHLGILSRRSRKFLLLEGWVVMSALARFGDDRLCLHEQAEVVVATSKPGEVEWPDWWQVRQKSVARRLLPRPPRKKREVVRVPQVRFTRF